MSVQSVLKAVTHCTPSGHPIDINTGVFTQKEMIEKDDERVLKETDDNWEEVMNVLAEYLPYGKYIGYTEI